jgi:methyl-accepting chemotaxis protein
MKEYSNQSHKQKNTIYYISIGDLISKRLIVDYFPQGKGNQHIFKDYARNIIDKILTISIGPNERYKETLSDNKKFNVTTDNKANICFMILTNDTFPERYSYKLLMDLESKSITTIYKHYINKVILDVLDRAEYFKTFAKDIQLYMVELERKYRSIVENDKISIIEEDVNDLKIDIKRNIDKMLTNIEMVSDLEEKSHALKDMAKEYKTGTKELKRASWRRNKITMVAGGLSIGTLIFFGARYFLK